MWNGNAGSVENGKRGANILLPVRRMAWILSGRGIIALSSWNLSVCVRAGLAGGSMAKIRLPKMLQKTMW
eukprot:10056588-Karenia_brevis.AAC.1